MAFLGGSGSVSMVQFVWAGTPGAGPSRLQWPWCATVVSEQTNLHNLHNLHIQVGLWLPAAVKKARLKCKFLVCVTFVLVFWAHVLYSHRFHWDFLPLSLSEFCLDSLIRFLESHNFGSRRVGSVNPVGRRIRCEGRLKTIPILQNAQCGYAGNIWNSIASELHIDIMIRYVQSSKCSNLMNHGNMETSGATPLGRRFDLKVLLSRSPHVLKWWL